MNCAQLLLLLLLGVALDWAGLDGAPIVLRCVDSCVREVESHGAREK